MKPNVNFKSKVKNSFIYFQLGLITTMIVVLFVLEYKFESKVETKDSKHVVVYVEKPFSYNPTLSKVVPIKEITPVKNIVKVTNVFKKVENNLVVKKEETNANEVLIDATLEPTNEVIESSSKEDKSSSINEKNIFSVEQLPMFDACVGLSREKQFACFESELAKAVFKNVRYPVYDQAEGIQGTALVEFIIDENGDVVNVKALDNNRATNAMMKAAENAVKKLPKLIPAQQGKENVKIKYQIPIAFKIK